MTASVRCFAGRSKGDMAGFCYSSHVEVAAVVDGCRESRKYVGFTLSQAFEEFASEFPSVATR